jgi:hypothetical protein
MHNRLQHFPPPPNIKPAKSPKPAHRLTPVAAVAVTVLAVEAPVLVIEAPVVKAEAKPIPVDFRPAHPDVALRAYYIFINEGARHGSDVRHWLEAELQLLAEHQAA